MKKLFLFIFCMIFNLGFSQKEGKVKGFLSSDQYNIENEIYIKFNFQKHSNENTSYKFKFFEGINDLEFWGHHSPDSEKSNRYFSILTNDFKVNLKGNEIQNFYDKVMNNYMTYQKEIRIQKPNVHLDINLNEEGSFSFSSHMIDLKSNYSFWLDKKKYLINEKDFLKFMTKVRLYYDFKKVELVEE
tara:strand:+ start:133 stop:693 length:561 start_codon:yes stop_codon:yes gene_type:complete